MPWGVGPGSVGVSRGSFSWFFPLTAGSAATVLIPGDKTSGLAGEPLSAEESELALPSGLTDRPDVLASLVPLAVCVERPSWTRLEGELKAWRGIGETTEAVGVVLARATAGWASVAFGVAPADVGVLLAQPELVLGLMVEEEEEDENEDEEGVTLLLLLLLLLLLPLLLLSMPTWPDDAWRTWQGRPFWYVYSAW